MKIRSSLQLTLAILKPDLMTNPVRLQNVKEKILKEKFWVIRWSILQWQRKDAEQFYQEHRGKFFFQRLTSFMTSGPIMPMILAREDGINHWRSVMGPTKTTKAKLSHPHSIRGMYGLTDTRNATHGSDSVETAEKEMKIFFPDFDSTYWMKTHADSFEDGKVVFDEKLEIHKLVVKPAMMVINRKNSGSACGRMEGLEKFETAEDNNLQLAKEIFKSKGKERWSKKASHIISKQ